MIEKNFDISFVASMALREKQIQQNYRPYIAIHKWFTRRPGALFRSLILSEFNKEPLSEEYFKGHNFTHKKIADLFMGGGIPLIEANRLGCDVIGYDINPMSFWIVKQEIEHLDLMSYREHARNFHQKLEEKIQHFYTTRCDHCGDLVPFKYCLWVKTYKCRNCSQNFDLFPGYLIAKNRRHPKNVFVCSICGNLNETNDRETQTNCHHCGATIVFDGPAKRNRCKCPHCDFLNKFPDPKNGAPQHRLFAIEYHCEKCKTKHKGRFFKKPDPEDLLLYESAQKDLNTITTSFIPSENIQIGDETKRLIRWGYSRYYELFNSRQLLGLELSCQIIAGIPQLGHLFECEWNYLHQDLHHHYPLVFFHFDIYLRSYTAT